MKPTEVLARERTRDGEELTLTRHDGAFYLNLAGTALMSSRAHGSERALATLGCATLPKEKPRVLVGGIGFGYTLRATLDVCPRDARILVAEISGLVIAANEGEVGELAGRPLKDRRVTVVHDDVRNALGREPFDAILLDVDNGPRAFTMTSNERLYSQSGLELIKRSLTSRGTLAVWAEAPDPGFERRFERAGFETRVEHVRATESGRGPRHTIYLGRRPKL